MSARERIVPVLVPVPVETPFDYRWPHPELPVPGQWVEVPFGPRRLVGVVWPEAAGGKRPGRLRDVGTPIPLPPLPRHFLTFLERIRGETLIPLGMVLRLVASVPAAFRPPPAESGYRLRDPAACRLTPARRRLVELLADGGVRRAEELRRLGGIGPAVLRGALKAGLIEAVALEPPPPPVPDPDHAPPTLTPAQAEAAHALVAAVRARRHDVLLLEGVPGAGKTEVYFEALAEVLRQGGQALVLLPEILLSAQWLERFRARFGCAPAVWHSGLTPARRRDLWREIARGRVRVVVGARSAVFLPLVDLRLLVIDEEQDPSFKQEDGPRYDARLAAHIRAELCGCPLVRVTATPAVESAFHAGLVPGFTPPARWTLLRLPERHGRAPEPRVELVDLRRHRPPPRRFLSPHLLEAVAATLEAGGQAMLFLNRRGYAPLVLCRACGSRLRCPNCSAWLVLHRLERRLQCHHCAYREPEPTHCPHCGTVGELAPCGPGVERILEEVAARLPGTRTVLVTSDTVRTAAQAETLVQAVLAREVELLIGTQLLAKGHHFPDLLLVGVVDADVGLGGDLRAAERSYQLLRQLMGRAGRAERPGRVLIQTTDPGHPVLQALAAGDPLRFYAAELAERREAGMPPFGRLAALVVAGRAREEVQQAARRLARAAPAASGVRVLGPAPAPMPLLRGRYRERLLVRAEPEVDLPAYLRCWLQGVRLESRLRLDVDVDPQSFL